MSNFDKLVDNLEPVMDSIMSGYSEIWRQEYPLLGIRDRKVESSKEILNKVNKSDEFVLYIHIPFCENRNKCDYCGYFAANDIHEFGSSNYVDCLISELKLLIDVGKKKVLSIFMGGGTPSLLEPADFDRLMSFIYESFEIDSNAQISIEATPYSITEEKAASYAKNNVNRLCLGVQSFNEEKLRKVNRPQRNKDVYNAVKILRKNGIDNIHFDLIYNLIYGETVEEFIEDNLEHVLNLRPQNIALFPLQHYVKYPNSIYDFDNQELIEIKTMMNNALQEEIVACSLSFANKNNYKKVTIENFPQKSSLYYFLRRVLLKDVCAVGYGGNSHFWVNGEFIKKEANYENLYDYQKDALNQKMKYRYFALDQAQSMKKYFIHRLCDGIDLDFIKFFFPESNNLLDELLEKIASCSYIHDNVLFLDDNFKNYLPVFTKNDNINYFLFCFYYLYSEQDQKKLFRNCRR